jgi:hypothetical protein
MISSRINNENKNEKLINNIKTKKIPKAILLLIIIIITSTIVMPLDIYQTPEAEERAGSIGYVYPLLDGFYAVEDWEVATCLHRKYDDQKLQEETSDSISKEIYNDFGGHVMTVSAYLDIGVANPQVNNQTATTNRYTVCWGIFQTGDEDISYSLILSEDKEVTINDVASDNVEYIINSQKAYAGSGAGGCEVYTFDKEFNYVILKFDDILINYDILTRENN